MNKLSVTVVKGARDSVFSLLPGEGGYTGVELGVASGEFAVLVAASKKFKFFWGIDAFADSHDTQQYKEALCNVGLDSDYRILRMRFDDALSLFPDQSLDFIYIDGYAETGQEGGATLWAWSRKVRVGGVIAGDDYHEDFPLLFDVINDFIFRNKLDLYVTTDVKKDSRYSQYPSWATIKKQEVVGQPELTYLNKGKKLSSRVHRKKRLSKILDLFIQRIFSHDTYEKLREWNKRRRRK